MQGKIAKLMDKGFGFIQVEGESKNLFFHMSDLVDVKFSDLKEGDKVSFKKKETPKGVNATNVTRL